MGNDRKRSGLDESVKPYKKEADYSYTLGAFPTFELLFSRPQDVIGVIAHSSFTDYDKLQAICFNNNIPLEYNDRLIMKLSNKENCYVAGIFKKYECSLSAFAPHIVLAGPSNMGNLGTILRTSVGFGIYDIAIILPAADIFNPKTVRASMGALFKLRFCQYASFSEYRRMYPEHEVFTFMLNGEKTLNIKDCPRSSLFSLVFGNESSGLDDSYLSVGTSLIIPQTQDVDSLNLTIAVGIGAYVFMNRSEQ